MSTIILVSFATAILLGSTKNLSFIAVGTRKMYVGYPQKPLDFLGWVCVSPQRQHFFSLQANLRPEDVSNVSRRKRRPRTLLPPFTHPPPPQHITTQKICQNAGVFVSGRRHKRLKAMSQVTQADSPCDSRFSRVSAQFPQ